jgi:flagellar biosynthesis activator protein FlaF
MYRFSYAEVVEDSAEECRRRERDVFSRAIGLLKAADGSAHDSPEMLNAIVFVQRLWSFFISDLSSPENGLPEKLKGQLISVGLWVMRESDLIVRGEANSVTALIDVNTMIMDGLK